MSLDDESVLEKKEASTVSLQCLELCCVRRVTGLHGAAGQPPCSLSWRRGRLLPTPNVLGFFIPGAPNSSTTS
uniref:Ig-like domain-containing protein n=1 Tax=Ascaris lumbricoides TaxID=6252 RepID=A0A0M3HVR6_ASCLU